MKQDPEMIELFKSELQLCQVREGEKVAVLSAGDSLRSYADTFMQAARQLGAQALDVHLPAAAETEGLKDYGKNRLGEDKKAMEALKSADMVIDLLVASFSAEGDEIQRAGARVLLVCEELEALKRMFPTAEHRQRTEASSRRIAAAKTFRFTNRAGTDVTYKFGTRYKPLIEYGYTADPGRWDHWPAGLVCNCAEDVNGRVVMDEGDIVYPTMQFLTEPNEFEIEGGYVRRIKGGREADEMRRWMDKYEDPRAYALSHVGWGTHTGAQWSARGIGMDGRSLYGSVLWSLGPNLEFGGDNDTACHMDLPMRHCSVWLDGEKVIGNGRILPDELRAPGF